VQAEVGAFLDRIDTLRPDLALFLADTTLRMRDKLVPLFAAQVLEHSWFERLPNFKARYEWVLENRPELTEPILRLREDASSGVPTPAALLDMLVTRHERVQRQATTDELTGLVNRRRFLEALETELERAKLFETPLSLALADLDDFKRVNDAYGHLAGDDALRTFADLLEAHLRKDDVAGRLGGEEFAVVLPETDLEEATMVADRMRGAFSAAPLALSGGVRISLTASFGIAELAPGQSAQQLVSRADAALYAAKAAGKNRVSITDPIAEL